MQKEIKIEQVEPGRFSVLFKMLVRALNDKDLSVEHYTNMLNDAIMSEYTSTIVDFDKSLKWKIEVETKDGQVFATFESTFPVRGMSLYSDNPEQDEISSFLLKVARVLQKLQERFFDPPTEQRIRTRFEMIKV